MSVEIAQIEELERLANERGATIYNIAHRNAGWGVQWHDGNRQKGDDYRTGLVVYTYYDTLAEAVTEETKRLEREGLKFLPTEDVKRDGEPFHG